MDEADVIMKWDGTAMSRQVFTQLNNNEPNSVDMYRKIMREGKGFYLWMTAKRLQDIGIPEIDVPILIEVYKSDSSKDEFDSSNEYGMEREFIENTLRKLTGLELPDKTPPSEWQEQWDHRWKKERDSLDAANAVVRPTTQEQK